MSNLVSSSVNNAVNNPVNNPISNSVSNAVSKQNSDMKLNELKGNAKARHASKRVGRGTGSGLGKTSGRGHKGAKSRSGFAIGGFEGGQMPIYRRMPQRGFTNHNSRNWREVTLGRIQRAVDAKSLDLEAVIDAEALRQAGLFRKAGDGVRVIQGGGELSAKVRLSVSGISSGARAKVESLGGEVSLLPDRVGERSRVRREKRAAKKIHKKASKQNEEKSGDKGGDKSREANAAPPVNESSATDSAESNAPATSA